MTCVVDDKKNNSAALLFGPFLSLSLSLSLTYPGRVGKRRPRGRRLRAAHVRYGDCLVVRAPEYEPRGDEVLPDA